MITRAEKRVKAATVGGGQPSPLDLRIAQAGVLDGVEDPSTPDSILARGTPADQRRLAVRRALRDRSGGGSGGVRVVGGGGVVGASGAAEVVWAG